MTDIIFTFDDQKITVLDGPYIQGGEISPEAKEFAAMLISNFHEMKVFAAKEYLDVYNESWREEDSPILNEQEFRSRLNNPSIVIYDELGAATIYFEDSNMFAGHSIEVSVDDNEIAYASLVG